MSRVTPPPDRPEDDADGSTAEPDKRATTEFRRPFTERAWVEEQGQPTLTRSDVETPSPPLLMARSDSQELEVALAAAESGVAYHENNIIGGRYLLEEGLAMGGMGAVFKVTHLNLKKHFALKLIHPVLASDYPMMKSFYGEAQILSQLDHPNIVDITDFGMDQQFGAYLVMEYLRGETLWDRLNSKGALPPRQAVPMALQIAQALRHIHGHGLVHRDIKPENIFLCRDKSGSRRRTRVKLLDFGLARAKISGAHIDITEQGGTPVFAAPEQFSDAPPQPSMDIYAVGVLLFEMMTGQAPFQGTVDEIIAQKQDSPPSPAPLMEPEPPGSLTRLMSRAMAADPRLRQSSMEDLIYELQTVADMAGYGERGQQSPPPAESPANEAAAPPVLVSAANPQPTCVVDSDGHIVEANAPFAELVSIATVGLPGLPVADTLKGPFGPSAARDLTQALATGVASCQSLQLQTRGPMQHTQISLTTMSGQSTDARRVWITVLVTSGPSPKEAE